MNKVAEDTVQGIPFVYSMGMGVRRRDTKFRDSLQAARDRREGRRHGEDLAKKY